MWRHLSSLAVVTTCCVLCWSQDETPLRDEDESDIEPLMWKRLEEEQPVEDDTEDDDSEYVQLSYCNMIAVWA